MKMSFKYSIALFALLGCFASCVDEGSLQDLNTVRTDVVSVEISHSSLTLDEGGSAALTATIHPWSASARREFVWSSSNPEVAEVDQNGYVRAHAYGDAVITAECEGVKGTCALTVARVYVEELRVTQTDIRMTKGQSIKAPVSVSPSDFTESIVYESSDESVLTVSPDGSIKAVSDGIARITVRAENVQMSFPVLVHGDLWMEQVDALTKPTSFEEHPYSLDTIRVARGETATVQMIVYAGSEQGQVTPSVSKFALKGGSGVAVTPELFWVRDVVASDLWNSWFQGRPSDAYPANQRNIPDALMPLEDWPVNLSAGGKSAFWAEFDIPRDLPAGIYEGTAVVQGAQSAERDFVVKVYDVTLPEKQTLDIVQWMNIEVQAMGIEPEMWGIYDLFENYLIPFISDYGQNSFLTLYFRHFETNRKLVKREDGTWKMTADFSVLGREIEMFARACPDLHVVHGPNVIASANRKDEGILIVSGIELNEDGSPKVEADGSPVWTYVNQKEQYSPEAEMYFSLYFEAMQEYLESHYLPDGRSYLDVYIQTLHDEPDDNRAPAYMRIASYMKKYAPKIRIMDPIGTHKIEPQYIDIPCPCIDRLEGENGYEWTDSQTRWIYSANGPQGEGLNRFIRIPLIKTRLMHWLNYRYHTTGYLHWGLNYWVGARNRDPWFDASAPMENPAGDMWIIWPGDHKVYPSIRLAAMRDGIRDYDLLKMLADAYGQAAADALCREIVSDTYTYTTDVERFRAQRKAILDRLELR